MKTSSPSTPGQGLGCPLVSAVGFAALLLMVLTVVQVVQAVTP